MKIKIPMMEILNVIHSLENQNDEKSKEILETLNDIFGPLLEESKNFCYPPTYEMEVEDEENSSMESSDENVDWEQRRYELVKDLILTYMHNHPNMNYNSSSNMRSILIHCTRQADFIIEGIRQKDILGWKGSMY